MQKLFVVRLAFQRPFPHFLVGCLAKFHQLLHRTDANFLVATANGRLAAPNRQRRSPVARTAQIPVHQIFQPVAEAAGARAFGLPVDGFVEGYQLFLYRRSFDKPAIERVVQHGLVGAPAVRVGVFVFFDFERLAFFFQLNGNQHIRRPEIGIGLLGVGVVFRLDVATAELADFLHKTTLPIHDGDVFAVLVLHHDGRDAVGLGYPEVVCAESRRRVNDARTVFGRDEIT